MYSRNQDSVRYLPKWKKQLHFDGKLGTQACHKFKKTKNKEKKVELAKGDKKKLERNWTTEELIMNIEYAIM